jgi:hypothetical protein
MVSIIGSKEGLTGRRSTPLGGVHSQSKGIGPHGTIASGDGTIASGGPLRSPLNFLESLCDGLAAVALRAAAGLHAAGSLRAAGRSLAGDLPAV